MKKKLLSVVLTTALMASMLAGCGGTKEPATTDQSAAPAATEAASAAGSTEAAPAEENKNPVTLKTVSQFGGADPFAPTYTGINEEFMAANPYITIEDNSQKPDEQWKALIEADFSVGNEPDVIQYYTDATADVLVATDKFVSIDEIKAEYPDYAADTKEDALKIATNKDGVSRAVPTTGYWEGLFCNKDLFDQYELALPTDWASLTEAIKVFNENDIIPIACSLNAVPHYWVEYLMLYAAGTESYTSIPETAPAEWVKGLETFKTLRDMGAFPKDTDTVDDAYIGQLFKDKKAAMQLDGSWFANGVTDTDNTVVVAFPGIEGQKADAGTMISGISTGFYITKKAWEDPDKKDAAVKFVMAHTNKDSVQEYWNGNGIAATEVTPIEGTPLAMSGAEFSSAAPTFVSPTDSRISGEAYKTIIAGISKVSTGDMSAEDLLNDALGINAKRQAQ